MELTDSDRCRLVLTVEVSGGGGFDLLCVRTLDDGLDTVFRLVGD